MKTKRRVGYITILPEETLEEALKHYSVGFHKTHAAALREWKANVDLGLAPENTTPRVYKIVAERAFVK
jgi:hypothetical protein